MSAAASLTGKAVYTASRLDLAWLRNVQCTLHATSRENPNSVFAELWGLVTDPRNLRVALARVARNRGRRTAGVDGVTVRKLVQSGAEEFIQRNTGPNWFDA